MNYTQCSAKGRVLVTKQMEKLFATLTAALVLASAARADSVAVAASIFDQHDPDFQSRSEVSIEDCILIRRHTRPNSCNGKEITQTVEKRINLREIAAIDAERFREPDPFMAEFVLEFEEPSR